MKNLTSLEPTALYWASFNRFELRLPGECVQDCSRPGPMDSAVAFWVPLIKEQVATDGFPNAPTPDAVRQELAEYGAWDDEELADDERNFHRLVWIAAGNIADDDERDCSEPLPRVICTLA